MAATLLMQPQRGQSQKAPFRCAVFFSAGIPINLNALKRGELKSIDANEEKALIQVPTAHIWGRNDQEYPDFGPMLSRMCDKNLKSVFIHEGGHEIPGARVTADMLGAVTVIRRAIAMALG